MKLSPAQKHLIKWLKLMDCSMDEAVGIMLLLRTPKQRDDMMLWMSKHPAATPSDLIGKALEITKENDITVKESFEIQNATILVCDPFDPALVTDTLITDIGNFTKSDFSIVHPRNCYGNTNYQFVGIRKINLPSIRVIRFN